MLQGNATEDLQLLGQRCKDKLTGIAGIATSICFHVEGVPRVCIEPGLDSKGRPIDAKWFDIGRIVESPEEHKAS